jgi:hypothetical protein
MSTRPLPGQDLLPATMTARKETVHLHEQVSRRALNRPTTRGDTPTRSLARTTRTGWYPTADMDLPTWLTHGRRLGAIGRGVSWWLGDWLRYGNARYGEKYARASVITGYDVQTLMNMVYVASRFEPRRRRDALSWSHHAELAALSEAEQERWLSFAESNRISVRSLRQELRATQRHPVTRLADTAISAANGFEAATDTAIVCPHCSSVISMEP